MGVRGRIIDKCSVYTIDDNGNKMSVTVTEEGGEFEVIKMHDDSIEVLFDRDNTSFNIGEKDFENVLLNIG